MSQYCEPITADMGGEVGELINKLDGQEFCCKMCEHHTQLINFLGYEHGGGIADAAGEKYWVYFECPKCRYQWSWQNILHWMETEAHANLIQGHRRK
jgi:hypothetical protein